MKKIFGIAPLIIALILGTYLSSQAQIVAVQPAHIDGGFGMFFKLDGKTQQKAPDEHRNNSINAETDSELNNILYPDIKVENEYNIVEYEVKYSICTYSSNRQTDLRSGSYYCKLVFCNRKSNETLYNLF